MKKTLSFLRSMRFGIILLVLVALGCVAGSVIPQRAEEARYVAMYGEGATHWIKALQLDQLFSAPWFLVLCGALMLNLLLCSITRFPLILRAYRGDFTLAKRLEKRDATFSFRVRKLPERFFAEMGFPGLDSSLAQGYAARRRAGVWGAWLTHLGMLLTAIGFAVGTALLLETSVYGVPGAVCPVEGTTLEVAIDSFDIALREDDTVEQYASGLTVTDTATGESRTGVTQVNHPMSAFGVNFYQNSTGWAVDVALYKGEALQKSVTLCAGEYVEMDDIPLALVFQAFYPDYANEGNGPITRSPHLNNPAVLFSLYYDNQLVDMNVAGLGYDISVDQYRFVCTNPRQYTLIQIVRDPTVSLAALGGVITLLGILLAFYVRPEEIWFVRDGEEITIAGRSVKGAAMYTGRAEALLRKEGIEIESDDA